MSTARFMEQTEDYEKLNMVPGVINVWEDGRQSVEGKSGSEVWYFDAILDDGSKFVGGFRTKPATASENPDDIPLMVVTVTDADGTVYSDTATYSPSESFISKEKCDFKCGPHSVSGDLKDYQIHIAPIDHTKTKEQTIDGLTCTALKGVGVNLYFHAEVKPFRHGAGRTVFGEDDSQFSSWLCIPRMAVEGTITVNGEERKVHGMGYHDHRCMAINDMKAWHHWLWGRQTFEDYTVVIYDLITSEAFGFVEIPLFAIYDKNGNIIFDNDGTMVRDITEMSWEEKSRKEYPKVITYHMKKEDVEIQYSLNWKEILEVREMYWSLPEQQRAIFDQMGIQVSYNRYYSEGSLKITEKDQVTERSGNMIYEFAYVGKPDDSAHLNIK